MCAKNQSTEVKEKRAAKAEEVATPVAAPVAAVPVVDARAFIQGVDREALELQIKDAEEGVRKAQGGLRSLISVRRLINYRDGKFLRNQKRRKENAGADGAGQVEPGAGADGLPLDDSDSDLIEHIEILLGRALKPMSEFEIAKAVGVRIPEIKAVLKANPDKFTQKGGLGFWTTIEE